MEARSAVTEGSPQSAKEARGRFLAVRGLFERLNWSDEIPFFSAMPVSGQTGAVPPDASALVPPADELLSQGPLPTWVGPGADETDPRTTRPGGKRPTSARRCGGSAA